MNIEILTVGKKHDRLFEPAIKEYEKRLKPFCNLTWHFIPSSDISKESALILNYLKAKKNVILLDERGIELSNQQLSQAIQRANNQSIKQVVLVIGGAHGVNRDVAIRADFRLKISSLVFPHQLVRLIIVEQIYRTFSILNGSSYHH